MTQKILQRFPVRVFCLIASLVITVESNTIFGQQVSYAKSIRPLLARNCLVCHGPDEESREAELRLDLREEALRAEAIVPGKPDESELIIRVTSKDPDLRMPPEDSGHSLKAAEIQLLKDWVASGAKYEKHWAFLVPRKSALPVPNSSWATSPIDHFVEERLQESGLVPSPEADRLQWLRRVSLDLTGLPPSLEEADQFLKDRSEKACELVVDRLLKSPAYGEKWARMWLDLARYADTKGYEKDRHRDIWRYRDWVIEALNQDMPYDQFTTEQLAGDLLPNRTDDQILATAFHRNTMTNEEGGTDNEEFRVKAVKDRVDTTLQVWMGLTMGCAKCHSHKYDPISNRDYYSFYGFFNQTQDRDTEGPHWPSPTADQANRRQELKQQIATLSGKEFLKNQKFQEAFSSWKKQQRVESVWSKLTLDSFSSQYGVELKQADDGKLIAAGECPEKDVWKMTFRIAESELARGMTAIRIETFPQSEGGGWPDRNVALREVTVELIPPSQNDVQSKPRQVKLKNARATFSQRGWEVARAIDGKPDVGWAISPHFKKKQFAVFEFNQPIKPSSLPPGTRIRLAVDQQYGQGLLLSRSRISVSHFSAAWLKADHSQNLESLYADSVFPPSVKKRKQLSVLRQQLANLEKSIPRIPVMLELDSSKLRKTKIHKRGNFLDKGESVTSSVLTQFGEFPPQAPRNRLGVSRWLMSPENPLTGRVMVNRIWARLFGVGLVETEEDFGTQGLAPSHPQLLDWLAVEFREKGWSIKRLLKQIVLSKTYRQTSKITADRLAKDPRNRLLSRGPRFRLSAEMVRDQALAVSGLLTRKLGGPSVMPPQPDGIWKSTYSGEKWKNAVGPDRYRRGLYTYLKRTSPYPAMTTFDAGSGEVCQIRRVRTNTPLQALVTLNDQAYVEAAGALAKRMEKSSDELAEQINHGFRLVLIRPPSTEELNVLVRLYQGLDDSSIESGKLRAAADRKQGDARLIAIANVLLNLDETLSKP